MEVLIFLGIVAAVSFGVIALTKRADRTNPKATGPVHSGGGSRNVNTQKK